MVFRKSSVSNHEKHFESQIRVPLIWTVLGMVGLIAIYCVIMLIGDRRKDVAVESYGSRSHYDTAISWPGQVIATPAHIVGDTGNWFGDYFFAVKQNRALKAQVAELSKYRDLYIQMHAVNQRYERLLNLRTEPPVASIGARSVLVSRGPFNNNRLIDSGSAKNIRFGNPVITENGLIGRVVGVSPHVSRVLMVTDVISRIPVMVARSDARAILVGDGGDHPRLEFVRGKGSIKKGDQILTSGDSGVFPRGLPVGEAVQGLDGIWHVNLYANRAPIDTVKVLLFEDFSQLPNADQVLKSPSITTVLPPPPIQVPLQAPTGTTGAGVNPLPKPANANAPSQTSGQTPAQGANAASTVPRPSPAAIQASTTSPAPATPNATTQGRQ